MPNSTAVELGNFETSDGRQVGLYELTIGDKAQLHRNRKGLRELLNSIYKEVVAALVVFVQNKKWRFSYVSEIYTRNAQTGAREKKSTDPKRYTYLLGEGERSKTAADRFSIIQAKRGLSNISLTALEEAFNVEKMSKDFFNEYRRQYGLFTAYLTGEDEKSKEVCQPAASFISVFKKDKKCARDFVKKLLGRIVFLYFLEKKGWLGVPPTGAWGNGDDNFLSNLFRDAKHKETFHPNVLVPLFYETLNTERSNELFKIDKNEFTSGDYHRLKIPFLNGGLFENDLPEADNLVFPEKLFADLFAFFDQYNFTVYEDSPDEHTVAIDPEMLGHIFENLLEDNKDKGAFYTPKEIVHYMCQESLIEYLYTKLNPEETAAYQELGKAQTSLFGNEGKNGQLSLIQKHEAPKEKVKRTAIEKLVKHQEVGEIIEYDKVLATALREVKVCDPAIGSGAFPMGVLQEIFYAVETLWLNSEDVTEKVWKMKGWDPAKVKSDIIQNSIYGVDIEKGAVDIARLRFWLSLVVDESKPKPLPNLDYKIVVGNSLLSKFGDEVIDIKWDYTLSHGTTETKKIIMEQVVKLQTLQKWQEAYFIQKGNKQKAQSDIRNLKIDILINQLTLNKKSYQQNNPLTVPLAGFPLTSKQQLANLQIELVVAGFDNNIEKLATLKKDKIARLEFFDWKLDFPEVMNRTDKTMEGFDIVIGNPPYVQLQKMGAEADALEKAGFKTFSRTADIYCLFYEKGYQLLQKGGNLVFITSNSWLRANYGKQLRNYLYTEANPLMLIDLSDSDIFQSATVRTNILQFGKSVNQNQLKAIRLTRKSAQFLPFLSDYFNANHSLVKALTDSAWVITGGEKSIIQQKVKEIGKALKNWNIEIFRGVLTGYNEAFIIDEETRKQLIKEDKSSANLIKPLLRGRDLHRYGFDFKNLYLISTFPSLNLNINNFSVIKKHLLSSGKKRLEQSGINGARKKTGNDWFETQDQIAYWKNFEQPKIIYPNMVKDMSFAYDENGFYLNDKCFIFSGEKLKYLLGVFNSKLFRFCFEDNFPELQGNSREIKAFVLKELPVKYPEKKEETAISNRVNKVLKLKSSGKATEKLELEIDAIVYSIHGLTFEEACHVDGKTDWMSKEEYEAFILEVQD